MSATTRAPPRTYRILIVDAMELLRIGLAQVISAASRFTVCAATGDYAQVASLVERHRPHLIIADPFRETPDGLMWIKDIAARFPETKILVATSNAETTYAERALHAGASGYWMKSGTVASLLDAIDTVLSGELFVSPRVALLAVHRLVE